MSMRTAILAPSYSISAGITTSLLRKENNHIDWDGHLGTLVDRSSKYMARRHEHFENKKGQEAMAKELERRVTAVRRLLEVTMIGQLVIRGDPGWCSVLFLTNPVMKAVVEFGGQGRIKSLYRAGRWPKSESDKVIQMLKDKLKEDAKDVDVAKRKDVGASKKRKRENGAY
jgi:hypothetical protein